MSQSIKRLPFLCLSLILPVLILVLLFTHYQPSQAADPVIYHVAKTGSGSDGLTWTTAYTDLQDALGMAVSGDELWVATGVYTPGEFVTDTFQLVNGVGLYGGFAATETLLIQRDWNNNLTVLSGDIGGDDVTDSDGLVNQNADIHGTNSYHVVNGSGVYSNTILDGFTINAGQANGNNPEEKFGGGLYIISGNPTIFNMNILVNKSSGPYGQCGGGGMYNYFSNPTLTNVIFQGNYTDYGSGGAMLNNESNPTLSSVLFQGNGSGMGDGGGMANDSNSSPNLTDITFNGNAAKYGGGMSNDYNSNPNLMDVIFNGNFAVYGGGMLNFNSDPVMENVLFSENQAYDAGGGMYNEGSNPIMTYITFTENNAGFQGGGIFNLFESSPILSNASFIGNNANLYGGGMANLSYSNPTLINVIFSGNRAYEYPDYPGGPVTSKGGGMYNQGSYPTIINSTFSGNLALGDGGAMYTDSHYDSMVYNSVFWNNQDSSGTGTISSTMYITNESTISLYHSLIQGSGGSSSWIGGGFIDGGNNIDEDPSFIIPVNPTTAPTTTGNLRLSWGSPAIDAGNNSYVSGIPTDLDGNQRIINGIVDMGAYETWIYIFLSLILH